MHNSNRQRKTIKWKDNKMEFFKKTGEIKGAFHARMGTIKDRNGKI